MDIVRDLKQYCGRRSLAIVAIYVVFLALFGMWAFHDMVTFDAEGFYSLEGGVKWYVQWIELGRWGFVALKSYFRLRNLFCYTGSYEEEKNRRQASY